MSLRADAQANRDRILEVAREALAIDPEVSLNAIGKSAGVGAGTLYRHFPSREALILGVYRKEIDALVDLAPALLSEHPPLRAFQLWCQRLAEFGRIKHGIAETLQAAISAQDYQETYWPMIDAVRKLLAACALSGDIRPGTDAEDLMVLLASVWRLPPTPAGVQQSERLFDLIFRGLGAEAGVECSREGL